MSMPTKREDGVDVVALLNLMESKVPGARAQYLSDVFTLEQPTIAHQRTTSELMRSINMPDGLDMLYRTRITDGELWINPDLVVVPGAPIGSNLPLPWDPSELHLMVEILSPTSEPYDRGPKREFAQRHQIDYWIVHPGDPWKWIEHMPYGGGVVPVPTTGASTSGQGPQSVG